MSLPSVRFIWSPFPNARIRAWGPRRRKSLKLPADCTRNRSVYRCAPLTCATWDLAIKARGRVGGIFCENKKFTPAKSSPSWKNSYTHAVLPSRCSESPWEMTLQTRTWHMKWCHNHPSTACCVKGLVWVPPKRCKQLALQLMKVEQVLALVEDRAACIVINGAASDSSRAIYRSTPGTGFRAELNCPQICKTHAFCCARSCSWELTWIRRQTLSTAREVYWYTAPRWSARGERRQSSRRRLPTWQRRLWMTCVR